MSHRILVLVDNLPRAKFFARFRNAFAEHGIEAEFFCHKHSSYRHLHTLGFKSHPLLLRKREVASSINETVCLQSLDVLRGDLTPQTAIRSAKMMIPAINRIIDATQPDYVFMWNGSQLVERVFCDNLPATVQRRYFEIANIPGKIAVDPEGVNAASSLFRDPSPLLLTPAPAEEEYNAWRAGYLNAKQNSSVPQAKSAHAIPWERLSDAFASTLGHGFYTMQLNRMATRIQGKLRTQRLVRELHEQYPPITKRPYLFLPFQVAEDTQLLLNSEIDNVGALAKCVTRAKDKGLAVVAKIHPAENSIDAIKTLAEAFQHASKSVEFAVSSRPTTELISNAHEVCTINSTVGLEALIIGKPLTVLGRSLFMHLIDRPDLLRTYLLRFLISVDYFGGTPLTSRSLDAILERRAGAPCTLN